MISQGASKVLTNYSAVFHSNILKTRRVVELNLGAKKKSMIQQSVFYRIDRIGLAYGSVETKWHVGLIVRFIHLCCVPCPMVRFLFSFTGEYFLGGS